MDEVIETVAALTTTETCLIIIVFELFIIFLKGGR